MWWFNNDGNELDHSSYGIAVGLVFSIFRIAFSEGQPNFFEISYKPDSPKTTYRVVTFFFRAEAYLKKWPA